MSIDGRPSLKQLVLAIILVSLLIVPFSFVNGNVDDVPVNDPHIGSLDLSNIYWPMIGRDPYHSSGGTTSARGLLDPVISWSANTTSLASVGADLTQNIVFEGIGQHEVFGIFESNNTHLRIREGDSGSLIWEMDVRKIEGRNTNRLRLAPALMDIDSDGKVEVLVYIRDVNQFQLGLFEPEITRNSTGYYWSSSNYYDERVWLSILVPSVPDPYSSPIVHDISGDGVEDVIIGTGNSVASFFGNNGTAMWFLPIGQIGETLSTPAIFPGSGALRRIVINSLSTSRQNLRTTLVNFNGTHLKNISIGLGRTVPYQYTGRITMPVIGDVTGDGEPEIMISYPSRFGEGRVVVHSYQLDELASISSIQGLLESTPSLADADGDGDKEIFLHSRFYTTSSWMNMSCYDIVPQGSDLTVSLRWWKDGTNVGTSPLYSSPLLCDLDDDDAPDAVFFANDWVHAVSFSGSSLWSIQILDPQFGYQGLIGDLGRDGFTDIFFDGMMISQEVVDLTVKEPADVNIYVGSEPVDGKTIRLHCIIENLGTSPATDVTVLFEGTPPGEEISPIGYLALDEVVTTAEASIDWTPVGVGLHRIDVTIDPNSTIIEMDETNNQGWTEFNVRTAVPDLIIHDIKFLRGDGLLLEGGEEGKRLVENDPSTILVQVGNIGEGPSFVGLIDVLVNGSSPGSQARDVPIDSIQPGQIVNVSVPWTPEEMPEDVDEESYNISASIDTDTQGMQEMNKFNNDGYNTTRVKSKDPVGGFEISGRVINSLGQGETQVRVTATNQRTQSSLEDETNFQGDYSIYFPLTDYQDGDVVSLYGKKTTSWAQNSTRIYSEDGSGTVDLTLTDVPTLSLSMIPDGQLEYEVLPRVQYNLRFWAENTGNIGGEFSLEKRVYGNSSLTSSEFLITPSHFSLDAGEQREITIRFTVPADEDPGRVAGLTIDGTLTGNGSDSSSLSYIFTVGRSGAVYHEFESEKNVTLNANKENQASFRIYILNQGNIPIQYNLTVSETLSPYAMIQRGEGTLEPSESTQAEITVTLIGSEDRLIGTIELRTSGAPSRVSWDIRLDIKYPNLVADEMIRLTDENVELGDRITLLGTVQNSGEVEAENVHCSFYEGETLIGSTTLDYLGPGEEATLTGVDWEPEDIGEREIIFKIDPEMELLEEDKDDNEAMRSFSFYPDISISSVEFQPEIVNKGEQVKARVTVKNIGNARIVRGFSLTIRAGSELGDLLATQDYDEDILTGGINTVEVELLFASPEETGKIAIWLGVTLISAEEKDKDNNDHTKDIEVEAAPEQEKNYTVFIIIGAGVAVLVIGASLYIWKFGLPMAPPPGEQEEPKQEDIGPQVEAVPTEPEIDEGAIEEEPVMEMHLEPTMETEEPIPEPEVEEVIVAEVVEELEDVPKVPLPPELLIEEDEDGLIPEV